MNWLKLCFETCEKDLLFLGEKVLIDQVSEQALCNELKNINKGESTYGYVTRVRLLYQRFWRSCFY